MTIGHELDWVHGRLFGARHDGVVVRFDEYMGIGSIELSDGGQVEFHCVEIVDGTRTIEVGRRVNCSLGAVNLGRVEGVSILKLDPH